jgi:adenylate cyclase
VAAVRQPGLLRQKLALAATIVALGVLDQGLLRLGARLDAAVSDGLLARHATTRPPDVDVVLVGIDERSLELMAEEFGRWPWPRHAHAELVEGLRGAGAAAIVIDVLMAEPDLNSPDGDRWFAEVAQDPHVFLPLVRLDPSADSQGVALDDIGVPLGFMRSSHAVPYARAALALPYVIAETAAVRVGAINHLADPDGVGRRYWLAIDVQGWRIPSLAARAAADLGWHPPADEAVEINWRRGSPARSRHSFVDVLQMVRDAPERAKNAFNGKIVVIGADASSLGDVRRTPIASALPGFEVLASALETLKNGDGLVRPPAWVGYALGLAVVGALAWAAAAGATPVLLGSALLAATPLAAGAAWVGLGRGWILPVAEPLAWGWLFAIGSTGLAWIRERSARRNVEQTFGRFVDPRVVADLVRAGGAPAVSGETREITVLFSDIRGFTALSEAQAPEQIVALLNDYFTRQVEVIFRHGGTVDKFIGDCIMAFWGAPVTDPDHALHAVKAALEMAEVAREFRSRVPGSAFQVGIGLNSGPAVVGLIGAPNKLDYTVIGDTVNLASRIEGVTKGVAPILVSEATRRLCGDAIAFRGHGKVKVKGREAEVVLHEPSEVK